MRSSRQRLTARRPSVTEGVTLGLLFAVAVGGCLLSYWVTPGPPPLWPALLLCALACGALPWRRSHPLLVLAPATLSMVAVSALGHLVTALVMAPLMAAQYSVSLRVHRGAAWSAALVATAAMVFSGLFHGGFQHEWVISLVNPASWVLLSAALGSYVRVRRQYAAARTEHAAREREEEARSRVVQERMRIARELHDVVAHHLALANAQAGTAAHLARTDPDQAYEMLGRLSGTTAAALRELKATVGLLRQDTDTDDGLAPAPGLDRLPDLLAACATAGLEVTVSVDGQPQPLSPGLDLTAYRIVQEALTNVTKHAATRTARVRLEYAPHFLTLTVDNAGDGGTAALRTADPPGPGHGFGLLGMRERALATGGTFRAGPRPGGGFEVACTLPLDSHDESTAP
ncbi:sensor histidine kinase [Streptomyces sp. HB132]|uniref:sensor histidine kinase n=1 Tax=Streptomyces sp. HB132 TaxID=767388 RepID=UPI001960737C|nr:sensor histidine kinase [Streptomyces sp. HB132]MBM7438894.1 signal transduction histidine kinase [Streptomyces sp. HB132]